MNKKSMKQRLINLMLARSFKFTRKPTFKLASGKMSNFYFNCKPTTLSAEGKFLIGNLLYELIRKEKTWKAVKAIGGLTLGADPVANAIAYTSYLKQMPLEAFVVRKEPKKHGTMLWIEGYVKKGDKVLIVEDVITTGGSTINAITRAKLCGLKVIGVVVLIDRQEGGREAVEAMDIPFKALLTKEEIFKAYKGILLKN
ncbi:MAG: orotate phosphoribosyltransferase [Thermodesulfovibrionia bacterium]|nr:orotate phosphoribosyltransferase [Thermodesulfovibrionia bacterium]